jgi:hypothetical protein
MSARRFIIGVVAVVGLGVVATPAAAAAPIPQPTAAARLTTAEQDFGSAPTSAAERAANLARAVPRSRFPTPRPLAEARPYGSEKISSRNADGSVGPSCSAAYAARSLATGAQYVLTAGHCSPLGGASDGQFFYPADTSRLIGNTGARSVWGTDGDFGVIRANSITAAGGTLVRKTRQPENGRIDTMLHAGDPVLGDNVALLAGSSGQVIKGFFSEVDQCINFIGQVIVCNMAVIQVPVATEGCAVPGDSGSPAVVAGPIIVGILSGATSNGTTCLLFVDQIATSMSRWGLGSAPASG